MRGKKKVDFCEHFLAIAAFLHKAKALQKHKYNAETTKQPIKMDQHQPYNLFFSPCNQVFKKAGYAFEHRMQ